MEATLLLLLLPSMTIFRVLEVYWAPTVNIPCAAVNGALETMELVPLTSLAVAACLAHENVSEEAAAKTVSSLLL